jgi:hypothetical protein
MTKLKFDLCDPMMYPYIKFELNECNHYRDNERKLKILFFCNCINCNYKVTKCQDSRCGTCHHITEGSEYSFKGRRFKVNSNMSCDTKNVLYVITCPGCQEYYI